MKSLNEDPMIEKNEVQEKAVNHSANVSLAKLLKNDDSYKYSLDTKGRWVMTTYFNFHTNCVVLG